VNECTGCHQPMRGDDYVYTLPITTAAFNHDEVVNNSAAALPATLPYQPLTWNPITMYVDRKARTMATLYGNHVAIEKMQMRGAAAPSGGPKYPTGAVLALVTWEQRDDPHWFGGRIPSTPVSIEFVQVGVTEQTSSYQRFAGKRLIEEHPATSVAAHRTSFMLGLTPAPLP